MIANTGHLEQANKPNLDVTIKHSMVRFKHGLESWLAVPNLTTLGWAPQIQMPWQATVKTTYSKQSASSDVWKP